MERVPIRCDRCRGQGCSSTARRESKEYTFWAPPTAVTAFRGAHVTVVTEANNHGEDCGR
jgi:hypothetical protein